MPSKPPPGPGTTHHANWLVAGVIITCPILVALIVALT
jgi:hypothetical protein